MSHRSSRSRLGAGTFALIVAAAVALSAVVAVYFKAIPAGLIGGGGAVVEREKRQADHQVVQIISPRKAKPAPKAGVEGEIDHEEGDGEPPVMARPSESLKVSEPVAPKAPLVVEYEARARQTPETPTDQKKLALWCEKRALVAEARSHWEAVVRLKPDDETARNKLGFRKRGGIWKTEAMIAEEAEQAKADKVWFATLTNLHKRLHATDLNAEAGREKALKELGEVRDPLASYTLWRVFGGHRPHHLMVARQLGRIKSPQSSKMLAAVAAYSTDEKAQAAATEELKDRDPIEFAGPLIALLASPLKYRTVNLPSEPGQPRLKALEIEDERFYRQFVYSSATTPVDLSADAFGGGCSQMVRWMNFGWTSEGRQMARELNQAQVRLTQEAADLQLKSDVAALVALNKEISRRNDRVQSILSKATRTDFGVDRDEWNRWFAGIQGVKYSPPQQIQKISIAQFVEPMYQPSFITVPPTPT